LTDLPSLDEAQALVRARIPRLPSERVPLEQATGRVLAEPALAVVDLPPFPSSAMDGFAVRTVDTPGSLPIAFRIAAGRPSPRPLAAGEAMAIATGAVVPDGADGVVPIEDVTVVDERVTIPAAVVGLANVRRRAGDVRAGDEVAAAGTRLAPRHIGALAAAGVHEVVCARRPRVAVLATGTELRRPGEPLEAGQIYESNSVMLEAQLAAVGAAVERLAAAADEPEAHRAAIERGLTHDALVTSGGVSVGPHDLVRRVEEELGVEEVLWRVALKPGKPVSFGVRGDTLVFGLPGNPVSSLVGCELFVRPALLALQGATDPGPHWRPGVLARDVRRDERRDELVRARSAAADGAVRLDPIAGQESHMIVRAAAADALVLVPRGPGPLPAGSAVRYLSLS
jgi:molybdopterin molybdotransferase